MSHPVSSYTRVRAALRTWGNGPSDRNDAMDQRLNQVRVGMPRGRRGRAVSAAGWRGISPAAIVSDSPSQIRAASRPEARRAAISRYWAFATPPRAVEIPARVAASSRARTVCDLPEPVAPQTNTCRLSEAGGSTGSPAGRRASVRPHTP